METLTKLLPVIADLYCVKSGQTGQTALKEKSSKGQIPWHSETRQAATGKEESILQSKAVGALLSLKNLWANISPAVPALCAKGQAMDDAYLSLPYSCFV